MQSNPTQYCLMLCNKIGYYLKVIHGICLKKMSVEFSVDEFGVVWLLYAKDIVVAEKNKLEVACEKIIPEFLQNEVKREQIEKLQWIKK